jgi:hypothetical protein
MNFSGALKANAGPRKSRPGVLPCDAQYLGAGAAPPLALHDDLPLLAGAALPPDALQELLPPAPAAGAFGSGVAAAPPPHATAPPMRIPATAVTAKVFAMFMSFSSAPARPAKRPG